MNITRRRKKGIKSNEPISMEVCSKKRQSVKSSTSENPALRMR